MRELFKTIFLAMILLGSPVLAGENEVYQEPVCDMYKAIAQAMTGVIEQKYLKEVLSGRNPASRSAEAEQVQAAILRHISRRVTATGWLKKYQEFRRHSETDLPLLEEVNGRLDRVAKWAYANKKDTELMRLENTNAEAVKVLMQPFSYSPKVTSDKMNALNEEIKKRYQGKDPESLPKADQDILKAMRILSADAKQRYELATRVGNIEKELRGDLKTYITSYFNSQHGVHPKKPKFAYETDAKKVLRGEFSLTDKAIMMTYFKENPTNSLQRCEDTLEQKREELLTLELEDKKNSGRAITLRSQIKFCEEQKTASIAEHGVNSVEILFEDNRVEINACFLKDDRGRCVSMDFNGLQQPKLVVSRDDFSNPANTQNFELFIAQILNEGELMSIPEKCHRQIAGLIVNQSRVGKALMGENAQEEIKTLMDILK